MIAVVTGVIATYPVGGVAWDYGQYALGLERLGFDVYYLEDSGLYTFDADANAYGDDCSTVCGFSPRPSAHCRPLWVSVGTFVILTGRPTGCRVTSCWRSLPHRISSSTSPGSASFATSTCRRGGRSTSTRIRAGTIFTGSRCGTEATGARDTELSARMTPSSPTHSLSGARAASFPITVSSGTRPAPRSCATVGRRVPTATVDDRPHVGQLQAADRMGGQSYGSKEPEFARIEMLPSRTDVTHELAVGGENPPRERWNDLGWRVVDSVSSPGRPASIAPISRRHGASSASRRTSTRRRTRGGSAVARAATSLQGSRLSSRTQASRGTSLPATGPSPSGHSTRPQRRSTGSKGKLIITASRRASWPRRGSMRMFLSELVAVGVV